MASPDLLLAIQIIRIIPLMTSRRAKGLLPAQRNSADLASSLEIVIDVKKWLAICAQISSVLTAVF